MKHSVCCASWPSGVVEREPLVGVRKRRMFRFHAFPLGGPQPSHNSGISPQCSLHGQGSHVGSRRSGRNHAISPQRYAPRSFSAASDAVLMKLQFL